MENPCAEMMVPSTINVRRRVCVQGMRKFLKQEGVSKRDIDCFKRIKLPDGSWVLMAILKDRRVCSVSWVP